MRLLFFRRTRVRNTVGVASVGGQLSTFTDFCTRSTNEFRPGSHTCNILDSLPSRVNYDLSVAGQMALQIIKVETEPRSAVAGRARFPPNRFGRRRPRTRAVHHTDAQLIYYASEHKSPSRFRQRTVRYSSNDFLWFTTGSRRPMSRVYVKTIVPPATARSLLKMPAETFMRKSNGFQGAWPGRRHVSVSQTRPVSGDVKKIQIFSSNPVFGVVVWFARAAKASVFELNSILITIVNTIVNDVRAIVSRIQKEYGQMLRTNNKILTLRFW